MSNYLISFDFNVKIFLLKAALPGISKEITSVSLRLYIFRQKFHTNNVQEHQADHSAQLPQNIFPIFLLLTCLTVCRCVGVFPVAQMHLSVAIFLFLHVISMPNDTWW